jgi:hypothetical protein
VAYRNLHNEFDLRRSPRPPVKIFRPCFHGADWSFLHRLDYFEMTTSDSTFVLNDDARTETPLENKNNIVWYGSAFKNALFLRERMSSSHGRV